MQTETYIAIGLSVLTLAVSVGTLLFNSGRGIEQQLAKQDEKWGKMLDESEARTVSALRDVQMSIKTATDGIASTFVALRDGMHQQALLHEKDLKDYVRRDTFTLVLTEIKENSRLTCDVISRDVDKLAIKFDRIIDLFIPKP